MSAQTESAKAAPAKPNARMKAAQKPQPRNNPARVAKPASAPLEADGPLDMAGLQDAVGYLARRAQIAIFEDFSQRFRDLGLSPAQFSVLVIIGANPGRSQTSISEALGVKRPNFVKLLDELEQRGLAIRTRAPTDRRTHALLLTSAGEALMRQGAALQQAQEKAIEAHVGARAHAELKRLLAALGNMPTRA